MTAPGWTTPALALQVWDGVGWLGQAVFTWRMLDQWLRSERAGRSVVPASFWTWSLLGTLALVVYTLHRGDPVFLVGTLVNGVIYARNLALVARGAPDPRKTPRNPALPVAIGLAVFAVVAGVSVVREEGGEGGVVSFEGHLVWLAVGFVGQFLWASRFVLQWRASERAGRSHLPKSFFQVSLAGAVVLFAYAVHRVDWVFMAAYGLNPIPYARNLVLLCRERAAGAEAGDGAGDGAGAAVEAPEEAPAGVRR